MPVRCLFEARIAYFEEGIREQLRLELEHLLGITLVLHPPPPEDVTQEEMTGWLLHRGFCMHRGGNNPLDVPDEVRLAAAEHCEATVARTQGHTSTHEEIRERALLRVAAVLHSAGKELLERWQAVILAERLDQHVIVVHAEVQRPFGEAVSRLRAEAASATLEP